jgi:hypothetical protein
MPKHEDEEAAYLTEEGYEEAGGHDYNPRSLPVDEFEDEPTTEPRHITHGRPVSRSEYERLKEHAEDAPAEPASPAQEDPSTR